MKTNIESQHDLSYIKLLESILNSLYIGILVVNKEGNIIYYNQHLIDILSDTNYLNIYKNHLEGLSSESLLNKYILDLFPKSKLPEVLKTGRVEVGEIRDVNDEYYITSRFPLLDDENMIQGALAKIYVKNFDEIKELAEKIENLNQQISYYKMELNRKKVKKVGLERITSDNEKMIQIKKTVYAAAATKSTILISGESGTGKDFLAEAIWQSSRPDKPFIALNCATMQESLLEAELFGYTEGTFTGAIKGGKMGKLEVAHEGILFLDEIGDMSYQLQAKLLRFLQNKTFYRIGGNKSITVDVRIIAATNKNLEEMVDNNTFREDLYYRLNVIRINLPPLRERIEDIEALTDYFISKYNDILGCKVKGATEEALILLKAYNWPGNIRELENLIERAMNFVKDGFINAGHMPAYLREPFGVDNKQDNNGFFEYTDGMETQNINQLSSQRSATEKRAVQEALEKSNGNKTKAAAMLGISRVWLHRKIKEFGLS